MSLSCISFPVVTSCPICSVNKLLIHPMHLKRNWIPRGEGEEVRREPKLCLENKGAARGRSGAPQQGPGANLTAHSARDNHPVSFPAHKRHSRGFLVPCSTQPHGRAPWKNPQAMTHLTFFAALRRVCLLGASSSSSSSSEDSGFFFFPRWVFAGFFTRDLGTGLKKKRRWSPKVGGGFQPPEEHFPI